MQWHSSIAASTAEKSRWRMSRALVAKRKTTACPLLALLSLGLSTLVGFALMASATDHLGARFRPLPILRSPVPRKPMLPSPAAAPPKALQAKSAAPAQRVPSAAQAAHAAPRAPPYLPISTRTPIRYGPITWWPKVQSQPSLKRSSIVPSAAGEARSAKRPIVATSASGHIDAADERDARDGG